MWSRCWTSAWRSWSGRGPASRRQATAATADGGPASRPGTVAGTPGYMSPEQADGPEGGRPQRRVQLRGGAVRDGDGSAGLRRGLGRGDAARRCCSEQPKPPSDVGAGAAERPGAADPALPPEGAGAALPAHGRREGRAAGDQGRVGLGYGLGAGRRTTRRGWAAAGVAGLLVAAAIGSTLWRPRSLPPPPPRVETLTALGGVETGPRSLRTASRWRSRGRGRNPKISTSTSSYSGLRSCTASRRTRRRRAPRAGRLTGGRSPSGGGRRARLPIRLISPLGGVRFAG